jgi:hypothetical protein
MDAFGFQAPQKLTRTRMRMKNGSAKEQNIPGCGYGRFSQP